MGSPFKVAEIEVTGGFAPDLTGARFQDKYFVSENGDTCLLVQWDVVRNEPGFRIWFMSEVDQAVRWSERIEGCCQSFSWVAEHTARVEVWKYDEMSKKSQTSSIEVPLK